MSYKHLHNSCAIFIMMQYTKSVCALLIYDKQSPFLYLWKTMCFSRLDVKALRTILPSKQLSHCSFMRTTRKQNQASTIWLLFKDACTVPSGFQQNMHNTWDKSSFLSTASSHPSLVVFTGRSVKQQRARKKWLTPFQFPVTNSYCLIDFVLGAYTLLMLF